MHRILGIGKRIRDVMQLRNVTAIEIAKDFGIDRNTVSNYLNEKTMPDVRFLARFAIKFDISIDWLVFGDGSPISPVCEHEKFLHEMVKRFSGGD